MNKITKLDSTELEREIERIESILERSISNYLTNDLTRYLRRLQKERFNRQRAWENQERKEWNRLTGDR